MTLHDLNRHRELIKQLEENTTYVDRLRSTYGLKSPLMDDMPHGSGGGDMLSVIAVEIADLDAKNKYLKKLIRQSEKKVRAFTDGIDDSLTKLVFNLRFLAGMEWNEVANAAGGPNTPESVKKLCYRYLKLNDNGTY